MKAFKIKATMVQEYVSFGNTREEAIANYEYSQGYDFDQVEINGELFANGNVIDGKVTATSLGKDNFIVFNQKDWKFAKAMWLRNHDDSIYIKNYDGEIVSAMDEGNKPKMVICRKEQLPGTREWRNAWKITEELSVTELAA